MTPAVVLREVLDRLGSTDGTAILISEWELSQWPAVAVAALKAHKLIVKAGPAASVVCPGCEEACVMPVQAVTYPSGRALFIVCDRRSDISRVPVAISQVEQWQTSGTLIADLLARLLGLCRPATDKPEVARWDIDLLKGRKHSSHLVLLAEGSLKLALAGHSMAVSDALFLEGTRFEVDQRALTRLVDQPIAGGGDQESAAQRRERLTNRIAEEKAKGTKAFLKTVANEEGISIQRLKQIRDGKPDSAAIREKW